MRIAPGTYIALKDAVRIRTFISILAMTCMLAMATPSISAAKGGVRINATRSFAKKNKAATGRQYYVAGRRVPKFAGKLLSRWAQKRTLVHVDNQNMKAFIGATKKGYLEVVVPANTGHVWFRSGEKLYDFGPKGFRVSGVREITKERYGVLVKLDATQEKNLKRYLQRLETTGGKELGLYDFKGNKGFHCVSWLMRHSFGEGNFVKMLGGGSADGKSMPSFSEFMLKRAKHVEAVVVYNKDPMSKPRLDKKNFNVMNRKELRRVFSETGRPD